MAMADASRHGAGRCERNMFEQGVENMAYILAYIPKIGQLFQEMMIRSCM